MPSSNCSRAIPVTPTKTRTVTRTRSETIEERSPGKVVSRTTTRTAMVVVTETPTRQHRGRPPPPRPDDPPSDILTVILSSDSESDRESIGTPTPSRVHSPTRSSIAHSSHSDLSSSISSPSSLTSSTSAPNLKNEGVPTAPWYDDREIRAWYEARYPGRVPHPFTLRGFAISHATYYVVTAGTSVGIFTNWNHAGEFVTGIRGNKHESHTRFYRAWLAYHHQWKRKKVRVLGQFQDTAPLETQIQDSGLDLAMDNLTVA